ncbi:something about silencing protein 10 [Coemansia brasiliensis]|uniref:Something about silencing protein 10 n=1 Tax=Coemansia brasiliensis TaxID=2650707 RepID=A0A9W8LZR5_9FUNG|nr:something about silencing protein 10 [Coemansia brasiliensis]
MGRRQKTRSRKAQTEPEDEATLIRKAASIKAIQTWDDVEHESADEFDAAKDKVLVGMGRQKEAASDESDEEVLGVHAADSASEASSDDADDNTAFYSDSEQDDNAQREWMEDGAWGKQKYNYYDADDIGSDSEDDEAAAKEEEEEALRLQRKQLDALDEGDFIDELGVQLGVGDSNSRLVAADDDGQAQLDLDGISLGVDGISDAKRQALLQLPESEKLRVLQAESPELLSLAADMKVQWATVRNDLKPTLDRASELGVRADDHPALAFYAAKYQLAMTYLNNVAVYFVIKASTSEQRANVALRDHPVIGAIVELRRRLEMMDALQERLAPLLQLFAEELDNGTAGTHAQSEQPEQPSVSDVEMVDVEPSPMPIQPKARSKSRRKADKQMFLAPAAVSDPSDSYRQLQAMFKKSHKKREATTGWDALADGDLGDQDRLDQDDAEDKARAIRRLRNHAKRVVQARGRREAREKMSGDTDLPYKSRSERLRLDNVPRAPAGDDLGMDLDSDVGEASADDKEDYYNEIVQRKQRAQAEKDARKQEQWRQMVAANEAEEAAVDDGAKRSVNYQILKNKGMMPRRAKDNRNPRVKRRKRFEKAQKKLGSSVAQVRTLEGNYGGEATGIKSALSRSTRFG